MSENETLDVEWASQEIARLRDVGDSLAELLGFILADYCRLGRLGDAEPMMSSAGVLLGRWKSLRDDALLSEYPTPKETP